MKLRMFDRAAVEQCLSMPRAIELMQDAFTALSSGRIECPIRTMITNDDGTVLYKPAWSSAAGIFCIKIVSVFSGNADRGLPVTPGLLVINDGQTGMPVALMEAGYLTSLRTGAATGLATQLLAPESARVAALFGTGGQAAHQLEAMLCARPLTAVHVFSRNPDKATAFCRLQQERFDTCELIPATDRNVLSQCDIITTATTSSTALFQDGELQRCVHINAIGSLGPERTEIPLETVQRASLIVDQRETCLLEGGELQPLLVDGALPPEIVLTELGELLTRTVDASHNACTLFKSVGNAAQDIVCAAEILRVADALDTGTDIRF